MYSSIDFWCLIVCLIHLEKGKKKKDAIKEGDDEAFR